MTLTVMRSEQPAIFDTLMHIQNLVEKHFRDMHVQCSTVGDAATYLTIRYADQISFTIHNTALLLLSIHPVIYSSIHL
jgi:hypothetical protein